MSAEPFQWGSLLGGPLACWAALGTGEHSSPSEATSPLPLARLQFRGQESGLWGHTGRAAGSPTAPAWTGVAMHLSSSCSVTLVPPRLLEEGPLPSTISARRSPLSGRFPGRGFSVNTGAAPGNWETGHSAMALGEGKAGSQGARPGREQSLWKPNPTAPRPTGPSLRSQSDLRAQSPLHPHPDQRVCSGHVRTPWQPPDLAVSPACQVCPPSASTLRRLTVTLSPHLQAQPVATCISLQHLFLGVSFPLFWVWPLL